MKKSSVKVAAHPETGLVVTPSKNKEGFGTIRVDQTIISWENGFGNTQKRSAFITAPIEMLEDLKEGEVLNKNGNIIKLESYEPFYEGQTSKVNPTTGEEVLTNGRPTYLRFVYTELADAQDRFIDNSVEESVEESAALAEQAV